MSGNIRGLQVQGVRRGQPVPTPVRSSQSLSAGEYTLVARRQGSLPLQQSQHPPQLSHALPLSTQRASHSLQYRQASSTLRELIGSSSSSSYANAPMTVPPTPSQHGTNPNGQVNQTASSRTLQGGNQHGYSRSTRSSGTAAEPSKPADEKRPADLVSIHVCDEARGINKDFECNRRILLAEMKSALIHPQLVYALEHASICSLSLSHRYQKTLLRLYVRVTFMTPHSLPFRLQILPSVLAESRGIQGRGYRHRCSLRRENFRVAGIIQRARSDRSYRLTQFLL
jgi:hypothetical protein